MTSDPDRWAAVAIVLKPHGLRGAVYLRPLTRTVEDFLGAPLKRVFPRRRQREMLPPLVIEEMSLHRGSDVLCYFEGVHDRTAAEQLHGLELLIPIEERWAPPEGKYYFDDLKGLAAEEDGSGRSLGAVLRAEEGAAHDYLVLAHPTHPGREVLIPLIPQFVPVVDVPGRRAVVRIPEGLLDL